MTQLNITLNEETLKELMLGNRDEALRKNYSKQSLTQF